MLPLWRFKNSHVTQTALLADSGALVTGFTGSDGAIQWSVGSANLITPYSSTVVGLDGKTGMLGFAQVSPWIFPIMTAAMFNYLYSTLLGDVMSTDATIYVFNQVKQSWQTYQCIATLDGYTEEALSPWGNVGFKEVKLAFSKCTINTS